MHEESWEIFEEWSSKEGGIEDSVKGLMRTLQDCRDACAGRVCTRSCEMWMRQNTTTTYKHLCKHFCIRICISIFVVWAVSPRVCAD